MSETIAIAKLELSDWLLTWKIIEPVFRLGENYAFSPQISETDTYKVWVETPTATYLAKNNNEILGTYYIKPNQPELGSHVCNCGYIVSEHSRGKGVASLMCEHSQREAKRWGFRVMQFNLVVSTNKGAVRLWQKLGYAIVGTLPEAFKHPKHGFVDAFVIDI